MTKSIVRIIGFLIIASISFIQSCNGIERSNGVQPNILFILTDDQSRDEFNYLPEGRNEDGTTGNLMPNIDKLANEGVILEGLHCPSPLCVPCRFGYLTGMYASRATNRWMQDLGRVCFPFGMERRRN